MHGAGSMYALIDNRLVLLEDVPLICLVARHQQDNSVITHQREPGKDRMHIATTRGKGKSAEGEPSVMVEPKEAYNAPVCDQTNKCQTLPYHVEGRTHLTFDGSKERTRLKRP